MIFLKQVDLLGVGRLHISCLLPVIILEIVRLVFELFHGILQLFEQF